MSPYGYVQLFLSCLLCTGAVSAPTATCTTPRALSNIHIDQVCGTWFVTKGNIPGSMDVRECLTISINKTDETTIEAATFAFDQHLRSNFTIENPQNAGIWHGADRNGTVQVIYLSEDGTAMAAARCTSYSVEPAIILLSKQLPISSEKIEEFRLAVGLAGISKHLNFNWESEATCTSV